MSESIILSLKYMDQQKSIKLVKVLLHNKIINLYQPNFPNKANQK